MLKLRSGSSCSNFFNFNIRLSDFSTRVDSITALYKSSVMRGSGILRKNSLRREVTKLTSCHLSLSTHKPFSSLSMSSCSSLRAPVFPGTLYSPWLSRPFSSTIFTHTSTINGTSGSNEEGVRACRGAPKTPLCVLFSPSLLRRMELEPYLLIVRATLPFHDSLPSLFEGDLLCLESGEFLMEEGRLFCMGRVLRPFAFSTFTDIRFESEPPFLRSASSASSPVAMVA